jgi:hypothetical protein
MYDATSDRSMILQELFSDALVIYLNSHHLPTPNVFIITLS